ncbi:hypothetical protein AB1E18_015361 [Capra hircus]
MDRSMPGLPVHHHLPEFAQVHVHRVGDAIQASHPRPPSSPSALDLPWQEVWTLFCLEFLPWRILILTQVTCGTGSHPLSLQYCVDYMITWKNKMGASTAFTLGSLEIDGAASTSSRDEDAVGCSLACVPGPPGTLSTPHLVLSP